MADGYGHGGFGGGRHHGGGWGDHDINDDHRPGNQSESREYARQYDPRSEQEYTNRPEVRDQIDQYFMHTDDRNQEIASHSRRHTPPKQVWPNVGEFMIPDKNTWSAHAQLVRDNLNKLYLNPQAYPLFDGIIAKKFGKRALWDRKHRDFPKYEGLRTNLEILRNDIIGIYLNDGSYDPSDVVHLPKVVSIAEALGDALASDTWWKRPFVPSLSVDVAQVPGTGAAYMYQYLLDTQTTPGMFHGIVSDIKSALSIPDHMWGLPEIDQTPYSPKNLASPPPVVMNDTDATAERQKSFVESYLAQSPALRGI